MNSGTNDHTKIICLSAFRAQANQTLITESVMKANLNSSTQPAILSSKNVAEVLPLWKPWQQLLVIGQDALRGLLYAAEIRLQVQRTEKTLANLSPIKDGAEIRVKV